MSQSKKLLIVHVAGLGHAFATRNGVESIDDLRFSPYDPGFPALTCTAQAGFRTATPVAAHGMPGNGFFDRTLRKVLFWEQSAHLVTGPRIWDGFRAAGGRVAMLFWQQSLGESVDMLVSPAPIHTHGGGMIQDCYSTPSDLYPRLCTAVGRKFSLGSYWGPLASVKSSEWIASATCALLSQPDAPDLCLTYLPGLDYDLQRYGPDNSRSRRALTIVVDDLRKLTRTARERGYEVLIAGDYAITAADKGPVFPNRVLREAGLLTTRVIGNMHYPDLHASRAFCVCDHEIAHVYLADPSARAQVTARLGAIKGVGQLLDGAALDRRNLHCGRGGDILLVADDGYWFAYPWWNEAAEAPDYAAHVDIHNKPGYDPCELFFGWHPFRTSLNAGRIGGTHGRTGPGREAAWTATPALASAVTSSLNLAESVATWLNQPRTVYRGLP